MGEIAMSRISRLGILGLLALMLPLAASAAPVRTHGASSARKEVVPFTDLLAGASTNHPPRNRLYLARRPAEVQRWSHWIGPEAAADLQNEVDFRRYGLLAVFRLQQSRGMQISRVVRIAPTLALWLIVPAPPPARPHRVTVGAFHVVEIQKPYLSGVKRLVVIGEAIGVWH
jgi:hypothetical protein